MKNMDVHDSKKDYQKTLTKMLKSDIGEKNKQHITAYIDDCFSRGVGFARCNKYVYHLSYMAGWLGKNYSDVAEKDIKRLTARIEQSDYAPKTKAGFKQALKSFYISLKKKPLVDWIKTSVKRSSRYLPEDLFTAAEIERIIEASVFPRDKAIVSLLADGGVRPAELLALRVKDVEEDKDGTIVHIPSGKTGARRIRIVEHQKYVRDWLWQHPFRNDREAPLWPQYNQAKIPIRKALRYRGLTSRLSCLLKRAGVNKNPTPYTFRHGLATKYASFMTPAELESFMGWVPGSAMPGVYTHLSGKAVDDKLLTHYGLKKADDSLNPQRCPRCQDINPAKTLFCGRCGAPLSVEKALEVEAAKKDITEAMSTADVILAKLETFEAMQKEFLELRKEVSRIKAKS